MRLLSLLLLTACSHITRIQVERAPTPKVNAAVAEPLFLVDAGDGPADPFRANTVVGNITFSGGFVTETVGSGLHNVSKEVRTDDTPRYREQATAWLTATLRPTTVATAPPPRRLERRGTSRLDGKDNTSLPRVVFAPGAAEGFAQPTTVPWVITYASHNGGWFYGQQFGTGAGARVRVLLVTYGVDGSVLGWTDIDGSRLARREFSPTGPQLQDYLIALERRVGRKLHRALR